MNSSSAPQRSAQVKEPPVADGVQESPWLQRYAIFLAICMLALILLGAAVTSNHPPVTAASATPPAPTAITLSLDQIHRAVAFLVVALTLGLVAWLSVAKEKTWLRWLGWAALAGMLLEAGLGEQSSAARMTDALGLLHAYLAQFLFATLVAIAVYASPSWDRTPELVPDRFSLRAMALIAPALVILQVGLGAAYRHKEMGVLTHIFGAFLVAGFILLVGVLAVKQYPTHRFIRPAAVTLMSITGAQVLLGFSAFLVRLMTDNVTPAVVISTVAHVCTGALTLASSVVLAIYIRRDVRAAAPQTAESTARALPSSL
jgi:heme A synthase